MNFASGGGWPEWQREYRYGALVIEPPRELAAVLDLIRERLDPVSAGRFGADITVTPPLSERQLLPRRRVSAPSSAAYRR